MTETAKILRDGWDAYERQDFQVALTLWRPLADQGNAEAQCWIGWMYELGLNVVQDYTEAMKWYRKAADQGNASAQMDLGDMYERGHGVPVDYVQAYMWNSLALRSSGGKEGTLGDRVGESHKQLAAKMTPEQIAEAKHLAIIWQPSAVSAKAE